MVKTYRFDKSNYDSDWHIGELNRLIQDRYADKPFEASDKEELIKFLLRSTDYAATRNVGTEGGPFGAMFVDFNTGDGIPQVVGYGTNHVVPTNDPSAHAEMSAIRDTAKRLGRGDLSGLTLVTSCECCPMCMSAALGCKVDDIYFAATRDQAAAVGFSDADQYRLMSAGNIEQHAQKATHKMVAEKQLQGHDAVVMVKHEGKTHSYFGDYHDVANQVSEAVDPTALPVVQAIQKACAGHKELTGEPFVFHLPEDAVIVSKNKPHPMSLVAADWARIGRVRGTDPKDPALDSPDKATTNIQYLNDEFEHMHIRSAQGAVAEVPAQEVWDGINQTKAIHVQIPETRENLSHAHTKWGNFIAELTGNKTTTVQKY